MSAFIRVILKTVITLFDCCITVTSGHYDSNSLRWLFIYVIALVSLPPQKFVRLLCFCYWLHENQQFRQNTVALRKPASRPDTLLQSSPTCLTLCGILAAFFGRGYEVHEAHTKIGKIQKEFFKLRPTNCRLNGTFYHNFTRLFERHSWNM